MVSLSTLNAPASRCPPRAGAARAHPATPMLDTALARRTHTRPATRDPHEVSARHPCSGGARTRAAAAPRKSARSRAAEPFGVGRRGRTQRKVAERLGRAARSGGGREQRPPQEGGRELQGSLGCAAGEDRCAPPHLRATQANITIAGSVFRVLLADTPRPGRDRDARDAQRERRKPQSALVEVTSEEVGPYLGDSVSRHHLCV